MLTGIVIQMISTLINMYSFVAPDWALPSIVESSWEYFLSLVMVFNTVCFGVLDDILNACIAIMLFEVAIYTVRLISSFFSFLRGSGKL